VGLTVVRWALARSRDWEAMSKNGTPIQNLKVRAMASLMVLGSHIFSLFPVGEVKGRSKQNTTGL